jgi:2Fe-2S ferredoxin
MPRVRFMPFDVTAEAAVGESLFAIAGRSGIPVPTACNGKATCGLCRVKIIKGAEGLTPLNADEKKHLGNVYFITKQRLSCQARLVDAPGGDEIEILLPDAARVASR